MILNIGDVAPDFAALTNGGLMRSLSDHRGQWVVLYFYPKDNTSGCTKEACSFRDGMDEFKAINAKVFGISPDSVISHEKFTDKHNLNFDLLSDNDTTISQAYNAYGEKSMYGKKYMGVIRSTYIIDPEGKIAYINRKVKAEGHAQEIIQELKKLRG